MNRYNHSIALKLINIALEITMDRELGEKDSYIIEIEGFQDNDGVLIVKEIAITSVPKRYSDHYILEPPFWFFHLNSSKRATCVWKTTAVHGLEWEQGDMPYHWLYERLYRLSRSARRIFTYGYENTTFLKRIMTVEVLDIKETMPPISELPQVPEYCLFHGAQSNERYTCAYNTAIKIRDWVVTRFSPVVDSRKFSNDENAPDGSTGNNARRLVTSVIYDTPKPSNAEYVKMASVHPKSFRAENSPPAAARDATLKTFPSLPAIPKTPPPPIPSQRPDTPHPLNTPNSEWGSDHSTITGFESADYLSDDDLASILECPSPGATGSNSWAPETSDASSKRRAYKRRINWKLNKVFFTLSTLFWAQPAASFIAYDCGSQNMNVTTVSLLDVGECNIPPTHVNVSRIHMQLLQLNEFSSTHVVQCKISVERTIYHCGMHSHVSVVAFGQAEYIREIGEQECRLLHQSGVLQITPNSQIFGIKPNRTTVQAMTLAGKIDFNGKCSGSTYTDPYGEWDNVVVQGIVRIRLQDYYATVRLDANKLHFQSGYTCPFSEQACIDLEGGYSFWSPLPVDNCGTNTYAVLYEGPANKIIDKQDGNLQLIYSLTTDDVTFAVAKRGQKLTCGYELMYTDHPKLFVLEGRQGNYFTKKQPKLDKNIDLLAYVNSKFVYVERHIRTEMNDLYRDILLQKCNLEIQVLKNALILASLAPDEFAYLLMKGPGYMALTAGEVIHVIKCVPVDVVKRRTEECYQQVPVFKGNDSFFMSPKTHILMHTGTQITCNPIIPPMYRLNDAWYKLVPSPVRSETPPNLQPLVNVTWRYTNPGDLAKSGIYSLAEMESLRDSIMFPQERPSVLNTIARQVVGQPTASQNLAVTNLFDENTLKKLSENAWNRIWSSFMTFGTASAGILAAVVILRGIKLLVDTVIHGYALHSVYGWSLHIIGAIWSSVTHLLLHLNHQKEKTSTISEDVELGESKQLPTPLPRNPSREARKTTCPHGYNSE